MSNSLQRRRNAALPRPVMTPVRRPAVTASESPWPSWASNVLISRAWLSGVDARVTLPSVSVPSTSISSTEICLALFANFADIFMPLVFSLFSKWLYVLCDYVCALNLFCLLHQFERPQIVQVDHAENASRFIDHDDRGDFFLLHQVQRFACQHVRSYRLRSFRHAVCGTHFQDGSAMLLHQAP